MIGCALQGSHEHGVPMPNLPLRAKAMYLAGLLGQVPRWCSGTRMSNVFLMNNVSCFRGGALEIFASCLALALCQQPLQSLVKQSSSSLASRAVKREERLLAYTSKLSHQ
jgi:hypothetical protein